MVIKRGCVEVYTYFDGNEFIIERLYTGAVINYRNLFIDDKVYLQYRAAELTILSYIDNKQFKDLIDNDKDLEDQIQRFVLKTLNSL